MNSKIDIFIDQEYWSECANGAKLVFPKGEQEREINEIVHRICLSLNHLQPTELQKISRRMKDIGCALDSFPLKYK